MLLVVGLCWRDADRGMLLRWLVLGASLGGARFWIVRFHFPRHDNGSPEPLVAAVRNSLLIFVLEAVFWGTSVLLYFDQVSDPHQMGCWIILTVMTFGPLPRIALIPSLMKFSIAASVLTITSCVAYSAMARTSHFELDFWLVLLPLVHGWAMFKIGSVALANHEQQFGLQFDLARKGREASEAVRAKNRFLAAATHDLRQPIAALNLYLDFFQSCPEMQVELAPKIATTGVAVQGLFDTLFEFASLEVGRTAVRAEPVQIADLLRDLKMQYEPLAKERSIELRMRSTPAVVLSDGVRLRRLIGNVLSNAIKYTPPDRRILLAARLRRGQVRVEVWDQGIGIPGDQLEKVFDEFYRVKEGAAMSSEGLGLGLSIVARLAKLLNSTVSLESISGRGTRCTLIVGNVNQSRENHSHTLF
jgi:signal transduction histidine kinase